MVLTPKGEIDPEFFMYWLLHIGLFNLSDNSGIPQINNKHLYPKIFPVPTIDEQRTIAKVISAGDDLLVSEEEKINRVSELRKALMSVLLTGELRVTPGPRTRMTPKTAGWDELHLSENPAVELLESLGYTYIPPEDLEPERSSTEGGHPRRPPRHRPQAPEPLALRDQHRHGYQGGHTGPRDQPRRGQREALHLPHLRHRAGAGPRRRPEEPHRQVPRLRQP